MTEFEFWFDCENGMTMFCTKANTKEEAVETLKKKFPGDIGADGFVSYNNIEEEWIGW